MTDEPREEAVQVDDENLVRRFTSGEDPEGAFQELFRRYGPLTHAFFLRRIGSEAMAAEQNQELYLSVISNLERFRRECSFRSWLFSMAHNRLMQLRRRLRVHVDEMPEETPDELMESLPQRSDPDPESEVSMLQRKRRLWSCMARLSEVERVVVYGRYFRETTLREMTSELGLDNPSGARAALIAAQRKLKRCMERAGVKGGRS